MSNSSTGTRVVDDGGLMDERIVLAMQDVNRPIVIVLLLIVVAFALYLFRLSPLCVKADRVRIQPRPLDLEDTVFTQPDTPSPRIAFVRYPSDAFERYTDKDPRNKTLPPLPPSSACASRYPVGSTRDVTPPPPPAYTSFPYASAPTSWDSTNSNDTPSSASARRNKLSFLSVPKIWIRSVSPLVISKPFMHPESPLPGPPIEHERDYLSTDTTDTTDTTFLLPYAAPRSVSNTTLHYPDIYLPMPPQAYVYNRDSISSSKIGLAF